MNDIVINPPRRQAPVVVEVQGAANVTAQAGRGPAGVSVDVQSPANIQTVAGRGPQGPQGEPGPAWEPGTFEGYAANLNSSGATFTYSGDNPASITYANGVVKSFDYGADGLASVTLIADGVTMVKTLTYTGGELTAISYS